MDASFFAHILSILLVFAFAIGLAAYLTRRFHLGWRLWWIGFATFLLSQVGHIPFNSIVGKVFNLPAVVALQPVTQLYLQAIFAGLSAGLFEELFRYGMFRWWARDARSWHKGILAGAGHGGAEAIAVGVLLLYTFIQLLALRNADLSKVVPASQLTAAQAQVQAYWSQGWLVSLAPALERFLTIPIQISMAVIVLQTFTRKQWFWVWLAVLYHALIDASAVIFPHYFNIYWVEALVGFYTILSIAIIFLLQKPEPLEPVQPSQIPPQPTPTIVPVNETRENIDQTRYE